MLNLCVSGAAGKMGRRIMALALEDPQIKIVQAVEYSGHPSIGQDIGAFIGAVHHGALLSDSLQAGADVAIDFSSPAGTMHILEGCLKHKTPLVIGTTGLDNKQIEAVRNAGKSIPVLLSPNMSLGVNLLFKLVSIAAKALGSDYDAEVFETHHRFKKDAPGGTALRLAECIARARGANPEEKIHYGRHGAELKRPDGEIGIHALRVGDVVGDHTVIFGNLGERLEFSHRASTRDLFARGALFAAKHIAKSKPGFYEMQDILEV